MKSAWHLQLRQAAATNGNLRQIQPNAQPNCYPEPEGQNSRRKRDWKLEFVFDASAPCPCKADCTELPDCSNAAHGMEQLESLRRKSD